MHHNDKLTSDVLDTEGWRRDADLRQLGLYMLQRTMVVIIIVSH